MITALPQAYTEPQAAQILTDAGWKMCAKTLARLRESGQIGFHRQGRGVRYTMSDLTAYIERIKTCVKTDSNSETIGSDKSPTVRAGTLSTTTQKPAALSANDCQHLWAQMSKKRASSSRNSSP